MSKEKMLIKITFEDLFDFRMVSHILRSCYNATGNKFEINFIGSKGYFSHVSISCEGVQKYENRIAIDSTTVTKLYYPKKTSIELWHSEKDGLRVNIPSNKKETEVKDV